MKLTYRRLFSKQRFDLARALGLFSPVAVFLAAAGAMAAADPATDEKAAEAKKATEALEKVYALAEGEDLKCFLPPYPPERKLYLLRRAGTPEAIIDKSYKILIWHWDDGRLSLDYLAANPHDEGLELRLAVEELTSSRTCELEGKGVADLDAKVRADFVYRKDAPKEKLLAQLEGVIRRDFKIAVQLRRQKAEREVIVASGMYSAHASAGADIRRPLQLFGKSPIDEAGGVKTAGDFTALLNRIGALTARQVVSEVKDPPEGTIWCRYDPVFRLDSDDELKALCRHVAEQTGLDLKLEKRTVNILSVDRTERR